MNPWLLASLIFVLLQLPLLSVFFSLGGRRGYQVAATISATLRGALDECVSEREFARARWAEVEAERDDWHKKSDQYRLANEGILGERDTWKELYQTQAIEHSNAQVCLTELCDQLARRLQAAGQTVSLPPIIKEIQDGYAEKHLRPVLESTGHPVVTRRRSALAEQPSSVPSRDQVDSTPKS